MFRPKLFDSLASYNKNYFFKDLTAGVVVGIVALPLAIAFAIASGVLPVNGIITAVVAVLFISALARSRAQIGVRIGAFFQFVYVIISEFDFNRLVIAT